jgi:hypothetical protein
LLDPTLRERIAEARALGFRAIGVQTNGRGIADPAHAASLVRAGLTDVHLSIHGADAAAHEYHTGAPGSFDAALAALASSRAAGLTVVVTTVLTRSNYRAIAPLPRLLASRGVAGWCVAVPHAAGRALAAFDRVMPRLALALPFALHALGAADALGLPAWIAGAPACLLGPHAARALPEEPRAFAAPCEGCAARSSCPGVDAHYLARFGGDELSPIPAYESRPRPAVADLFVGPGETMRGAVSKPSGDSPRRVALPLLGKVKPALAETPASAPKRSGEALKEILPGLFEKASREPV